ncbi:MAG: hypothetical protein M1818_003391 [Claussenomyces sp. TS43310]|nr:MAG: hypothetical protein M1818_003391 [Claussenomyces sp. TS43310]
MATDSILAGNLFAVKDLVAVITGGGTGIGLMMARALALNGASKVYIIGRRKNVLEEAAASVTTGNIIPLVGDVTSKDDLSAVVKQIEADVGYVNVVIANSGILGPQAMVKDATSIEEVQKIFWKPEFDEVVNTFSVNTAGLWYTVLAFLGLLDKGNQKGNVEQKSQVIATSSIAGFGRLVPGNYVYGQSKAAVTHMVKQLASTLAPYDIRSNAIAPGLYPSELAGPLLAPSNGVFPKTQIPLQRLGNAEDMAGLILFLTSRAGSYLSGAVMITDGGRLSVVPSTY